MIKLGIRAHDIGKMDASSLFNEAKKLGFNGIQLVINKAIDGHVNLDEQSFNEIKRAQVLDVMLLGSYFNPIHSDKEKLNDGINRFIKQLELAKILNTDYVATETGSYYDDKWIYHPNNHTKMAYNQVLSVMKPLVMKAEEVGKTVLVEAAYNHVIFSCATLKQFVVDLNSDHVKVIVDLYNLLNIRNHKKHESILKEALLTLKPFIKVFHLKNYYESEGKLIQTGLDKGIMDYKKLLPMMIESNPDAFFIFEGITGEDIKSSLKYIRNIIEEAL